MSRSNGVLLAFILVTWISGCVALQGPGINSANQSGATPPSDPATAPPPKAQSVSSCTIELPQLLQKARPAIVLLETFDSAGKGIGQGTGFFISPDGRLVTNFHVIAEAHHAQAKSESGKSYEIKGVLAMDQEADIAILQADAADVPSLPIGRSDDIQIGERVAVIGSPFGLEGSLSDGLLSAKREIPSMGKRLQITAPISPGSSGSPVFDACGRVIGVASFLLKDSQALNFAIPIESVSILFAKVDKKMIAFPGAIPNSKESMWNDSDFKKAYFYLLNDNFIEASKYFLEVTIKYPNESLGHFGLGSCLSAIGAQEAAIISYNEACRLAPSNASCYYNRGYAFFKCKKYGNAIADFDKAIQLDPNDVSSYSSRGNCYASLNNFPKAVSDFSQAIRIDSNHYNAYYNRGLVYSKMSQCNFAIQDFSQCIRINPGNAFAYINRGFCYTSLGDNFQGCKDFSKACNLGDCRVLNKARETSICP